MDSIRNSLGVCCLIKPKKPKSQRQQIDDVVKVNVVPQPQAGTAVVTQEMGPQVGFYCEHVATKVTIVCRVRLW